MTIAFIELNDCFFKIQYFVILKIGFQLFQGEKGIQISRSTYAWVFLFVFQMIFAKTFKYDDTQVTLSLPVNQTEYTLKLKKENYFY